MRFSLLRGRRRWIEVDAGEKEPGEASPSAPLKRIAQESQVSSAPEH